jgi:hypothetical protein
MTLGAACRDATRWYRLPKAVAPSVDIYRRLALQEFFMTYAFRFHQAGGPEVLNWEEVKLGKPGPGEARIRHTAVGLNFVDIYNRAGVYNVPPHGGRPCRVPPLRGRWYRLRIYQLLLADRLAHDDRFPES